MRSIARISTMLAATLLVGHVAPAVNAGTTPLPGSRICGYDAVSSAALGPDTYRGVIFGGPVVAAALPPSDPLANPVSVTLICTLHVYGPSPDPAIEASGSGTAVAVVAPTSMTFTATDQDSVVLCTRARVTDSTGATTTYAPSSSNGMWHPASSADCGTAQCLSLDCNEWLALVFWLLDDHGWSVEEAVDHALCPVLASQSPGLPGVVDIDSTGDTYVAGVFIWDCPPYATSTGED